MFQSFCVALVVIAAMTETFGLYQWSRQVQSQGFQQSHVVFVAEANRQYVR